MSILTSKVDVLRGWAPGNDACIDQSLAPASGQTLVPGMVVALQSNGTVGVPAAASANWQPLYFVVEGNSTNELDTNFVGKVMVLRGKLTVKTDQFVSASLTVGGAVSVDNQGRIINAGANYRVGFLLENNNAVDGTITVELDI